MVVMCVCVRVCARATDNSVFCVSQWGRFLRKFTKIEELYKTANKCTGKQIQNRKLVSGPSSKSDWQRGIHKKQTHRQNQTPSV